MKQLTPKTAKDLKEKMYINQGGRCIMCKRELDKDVQRNHLDHDHALEGPNAGKVRGLLCGLCNVLEGTVKHKFYRSGLASREVDYITWLKSLVEYLEKDYSSNDIHPQFIPDTIKVFKRLSLTDMRAEMTRRGYAFESSDTRAILEKKFAKQFRKEQKEL